MTLCWCNAAKCKVSSLNRERKIRFLWRKESSVARDKRHREFEVERLESKDTNRSAYRKYGWTKEQNWNIFSLCPFISERTDVKAIKAARTNSILSETISRRCLRAHYRSHKIDFRMIQCGLRTYVRRCDIRVESRREFARDVAENCSRKANNFPEYFALYFCNSIIEIAEQTISANE